MENLVIKIGIYAICKNEEAHIAKWVETHKSADRIVVVDTGSTDNSFNLLKSFESVLPNLIVEQHIFEEFRFDDAKNYAMSKLKKFTTADDMWLFGCLDLDEFLCDNGVSLLKELWDGSSDKVKINATTADSGFNCVSENKFHKRSDYVRWVNPVHETLIFLPPPPLLPSVQQLSPKVYYIHDPDNSKPRNYLPLLLIAEKEHPKDIGILSYICWELTAQNDINLFETYITKYLNVIQTTPNKSEHLLYYYNYIFNNNYLAIDKKLSFVDEFIKYANSHNYSIEPNLAILFNSLKTSQKYEEAEKLCHKIICNSENIQILCGTYIRLTLLNYYEKKNYENAFAYAILANNAISTEITKLNLKICQTKYFEVKSKIDETN